MGAAVPGVRQAAARQEDGPALGQTLARVELQTVLAGVLARLPGLALAAEPAELEFRDSNVVYGVRSLPVTFDRVPA